MEEKFLKTRAEREEARQQKSSGYSSTSWDRLQFEDQSKNFERSVLQFLSDGNTQAAQDTINIFKTVVQDVTSNNILTPHEMAKSNATLSRLQSLIDAKRETTKKTKGFKFSSKPKIDVKSVVEEIVAAPPTQKIEEEEEDNGQINNIYGYAHDKTIFIGSSKAVFLRNCENCEILILPVAGSVFISNCSKCKIYVACHQLRLKNCINTDIYVWCASTPIIECCNEMRFGPYNCWTGLLQSTVENHNYNSHEEWVQHVGEQKMHGGVKESYKTIDDFQWLRKTQSPHWSIILPENWEINTRPFTIGDIPAMSKK